MQKQFDLGSLEQTNADIFKDELAALGVEYGARWPDRFGESLERWSRRSLGKQIPTLSLFSGAGGLDIGFRQAGFDIKNSSNNNVSLT